MAALAPKPRDRIHFAVKFAAGAMRVAAFLVALLTIGGAVALFNLSSIPGAQNLSIEPLVAVAVATFAVVLALILALILWGFADGLVLLADVDDAQRATQRQIADVILAQRTERGPFHAETVAAKDKSSL
ncbi:MAG TPA: hypothetical protein VEU77_12950 [Candidatus Acidoferrales bacterium]|nr:hypothetical protein [Candidatus Acidoferrales bacterium]